MEYPKKHIENYIISFKIKKYEIIEYQITYVMG